MSLLSKVISNLFNGVSQQPPEQRDASQATAQINAISSPTYGLRKRPGTTSVAQIAPETDEPLVHFINRDEQEQYAVAITPGDIKVFNAQNGAEVVVNKPHGTSYLDNIDPQSDLRLVSVADYTFVLNTRHAVQIQGTLESATDSLKGSVSFPIPTSQLPIKNPTDPNKTPGSGGSTGTLPPYWNPGGDYSGGGGSTNPGTSPTKPSDPSNPDKAPASLVVTLGSATLPEGLVGRTYTPFNFASLLRISGDSGTAGTTTWSATGVPSGMSFTGGVLSGTPDSRGQALLSVTATYNGKSASKTYSFTLRDVFLSKWPNGSTGGADPNDLPVWELDDPMAPLPLEVGDGDLMATLKAKGLDANHLVVTYRPTLSVTVEGDPTATDPRDLRRFFPAGATTFGGAQSDGALGTLASILLSGLQNENYNPVASYKPPGMYSTTESFPQLVVRDDVGDYSIMSNQILRTPYAVARIGNGVRGVGTAYMNIYTALAFDALFILPISGQWNADHTQLSPMNIVAELPVRISITGIRPNYPPSRDANLDMFCGRLENYYQDGLWLYNPQTQQNTIPIDGFTREIHRYVVNPVDGQINYVPYSSLSILVEFGISVPGALPYFGRRVLFNPPLAYKVVPKAGLSLASVGPYLHVFSLRQDGKALQELTMQQLATYP